MTHQYDISGMTCAGCASTVQEVLSKVEGVASVKVNLERQEAEIAMTGHIPTATLQSALSKTKYMLSDKESRLTRAVDVKAEEPSTLKTYLPIFLIFGYITAVTVIIELSHPVFDTEAWMRHFMAGFFLVFSFFKMLDIPAFAMSYSNYDVIAKRWYGYGYVYPFLELALGIIFLIPTAHMLGNIATLAVMGVSIVGVLQSVLHKRRIQCACLGAVFSLPMSTITIIEDGLMIAMSVASLALSYNG